jgi:endonuclease YncB( thermonuclease family)
MPRLGKVIAVADGDTLTLLDANRQRHTIRLADIDAPESCKSRGRREDDPSPAACQGRPGQPFSDKARIALRSMTIGRDAQLDCREADRYGRAICRVFIGRLDVNAELVRQGLAWYETRYGRDRGLESAWRDAMHRKVGLFADPLAIPPSAWRRYCWGQGVCQPRQILEAQ